MMRKLFTLGLMVLLLLIGIGQTFAQTTIFKFEFENTEAVTINNSDGSPTFASSGVNTPDYFAGVANDCSTAGGVARSHASWSTGDYYRFTVSTKGFNTLSFSACIRTSNTAVGTFIVRASADNGANWSTIVSSFTPSTTFASRSGTLSDGTFADKDAVWIEIYKTNNADQTSRNIRVDNALLTGSALLPITLESFTAKAEYNQTHLAWATATEQNNAHFLIQRSVDGGRTFKTIGQVAGRGDSNERVDYTYVDQKPATGTNYYRLHQFDYDGTNEFFGPVSVVFAGKGDAVRVWPTLAENELTIETTTDSDDAVLLSVYDLNGRLMLEQIASEKALQTTMSVAHLPAGAYFIRWQQGSAGGQVRFVKL